MSKRKPIKVQSHWRIKPSTAETLSQVALALGYKFGEKGAVGEMLDAIADAITEGKIVKDECLKLDA